MSSWYGDPAVSAVTMQQFLDSLPNSSGSLLNDRKGDAGASQPSWSAAVRSAGGGARSRGMASSRARGDVGRRAAGFEYSKETQSLRCPFKTMSLKKIKRRDTKTDEAVTEEKFALMVYTTVVVGDDTMHMCTVSNPIVVIVHGNQHAKAMATIVWDNYFSEPERDPFAVPEVVPWPRMAMALSSHFGICNHALLKDTDLMHLRQRLSRTCLLSHRCAHPATCGAALNAHKRQSYSRLGRVCASPCTAGGADAPIAWASFNREALQGRAFTFWEWFFGAEELVKRYLHGLWSDGYCARALPRPTRTGADQRGCANVSVTWCFADG